MNQCILPCKCGAKSVLTCSKHNAPDQNKQECPYWQTCQIEGCGEPENKCPYLPKWEGKTA